MSPPKQSPSSSDYFSWQGSRQDSREGRVGLRRELPPVEPAPSRRAPAADMDVVEHTATTSVVRRITEAMARRFRNE